jgi:hypothetical protein
MSGKKVLEYCITTGKRSMKRLLAAVGIVLMIGGLMLYPSLFSYSERSLRTRSVKVDKEWNISGDFSEGENISLSFRPDNDWSIESGFEEIIRLPPTENGTDFPYVKIFQINVTNPFGNFTGVDVYLIIEQPGGGVSKMSVFPDYFSFTDNGGVLVGNKYPKAALIGADNVIALGRIQHNGTYTVNCTLDPFIVKDYEMVNNTQRLWIHNVSAPVQLWLYGQREEVRYPFRIPLLLPICGSLIAVGSVTMVAGALYKKGSRNRPTKQ